MQVLKQLDQMVQENQQFFFAYVSSSDAATYNVEVAPVASNHPGLLSGIPLAASMARFLGARECLLPQPGSLVFCFKADATTCLILGVIPQVDAEDEAQDMHARSLLGAGDGKSVANNRQGYAQAASASKSQVRNANRPTDVVEGEHVIANDFGVLLGLFHHFATLKATELAQVQCFLMDDLVRIVAHNYEHFTCMGSSKVFQSGRELSQEFGLTHDAAEATGRPNVDGSDTPTVIELTGDVSTTDEDNFFKLKNDRAVHIDRLKGFIGALGDFVHLLLVRPAPGVTRAVDGAPVETFDRGLTSFHVGMDGFVSARSLAGMAMEKTNWIRVPHRVRVPEDPAKPEGEAATENWEEFKFDNSALVNGQPFLYFLQLRDYLAHTLEGKTYRSFRNPEFQLNDDPSKEAPLQGQSTDVTPRDRFSYIPRTSGIYMMPNGGIMLRDAWGSALVMEGGNIYLQPAKDMVSQPLRHFLVKSGKNVSLATKGDIDISSTSGGMRVKTEGTQYLYSDASGIILHSNAPGPSEFLPKDDVVTHVGGILLHSPASSVTTHAQYSLFHSDQSALVKSGTLLMDTNDQLLIRSTGGVNVFTQGNLLLSAGTNVSVFSENSVLVAGLQATAIGVENQTVAVSTFGPVQGLFRPEDLDEWRTQTSNMATSDFQEYSFGYRDSSTFDELQFRFLPSSAYPALEKEDGFPQTIAQQQDTILETGTLSLWEEKAVNGTYPYPGADIQESHPRAELNNLQFDPTSQDTYNKPTGHVDSSTLNFANVFKDYQAYG